MPLSESGGRLGGGGAKHVCVLGLEHLKSRKVLVGASEAQLRVRQAQGY
jgi:hypothetical protein